MASVKDFVRLVLLLRKYPPTVRRIVLLLAIWKVSELARFYYEKSPAQVAKEQNVPEWFAKAYMEIVDRYAAMFHDRHGMYPWEVPLA